MVKIGHAFNIHAKKKFPRYPHYSFIYCPIMFYSLNNKAESENRTTLQPWLPCLVLASDLRRPVDARFRTET